MILKMLNQLPVRIVYAFKAILHLIKSHPLHCPFNWTVNNYYFLNKMQRTTIVLFKAVNLLFKFKQSIFRYEMASVLQIVKYQP